MILRYLHADLKRYYSLIRFKGKWRKLNRHNNTLPSVVFPIDAVEVGKYTYGGLCVRNYGDTSAKLTIGNYCSIAQNSEFLLAGEHTYQTISTFPLKKYAFHITDCETKSKGNIVIGDDVWIGERALILSGVTIGQGAVIGAGAIVAKDVPPYAIFVGTQVLKYRFSESVREALCKLDYGRITPDDLIAMGNYPSIESFICSEKYADFIQK